MKEIVLFLFLFAFVVLALKRLGFSGKPLE